MIPASTLENLEQVRDFTFLAKGLGRVAASRRYAPIWEIAITPEFQRGTWAVSLRRVRFSMFDLTPAEERRLEFRLEA
eukprot:6042583-Alexandrium_andersonii.AAC.1